MVKRKDIDKTINNRRGRRRGIKPVLLIAILVIGGLFGWMHINASLTHLKFAEVYLEDLPVNFENTKILYVSDLNIRNSMDEKACTQTMAKLNELGADMLILGGDYNADTLIEVLNGDAGKNKTEHVEKFIHSLSDFYAPLGKFAVYGEKDDESLSKEFQLSGVQNLSDTCVTVEKDGAQLVIAGLSDASVGRTPYEEIGSYFNGDECVIAVAHNPSSYVGIRVAEANGGGAWADMVLSGHTLNGQIKLFGKTMFSMSEEEARHIGGWYYANDLPMLVSQGLGCNGLKLRLGTQSEVWCITLHKPKTEGSTLPKL